MNCRRNQYICLTPTPPGFGCFIGQTLTSPGNGMNCRGNRYRVGGRDGGALTIDTLVLQLKQFERVYQLQAYPLSNMA